MKKSKSENFDSLFIREFEPEPVFKDFRYATPAERDEMNDYIIEKYGVDNPLVNLIQDWARQIVFTIDDARSEEILTYALIQAHVFNKSLFHLLGCANLAFVTVSRDNETFNIVKRLRRKHLSIFLDAYKERMAQLGLKKPITNL